MSTTRLKTMEDEKVISNEEADEIFQRLIAQNSKRYSRYGVIRLGNTLLSETGTRMKRNFLRGPSTPTALSVH